MSQVPVKWVRDYELCDEPPEPLESIPVVPLSALREVVDYLREQVKYHDALCMDNIEEEGCTCGHATATRLLASLGEVGK